MGGKSQPAPDYSGMEQVAREQLNFAKQQYADLKPIAQEIGGLQADAQRQQMAQAGDYYDYMQSTFRPVEQSLVSQAQEFNTDAYRQQMAQQASTAAARAFEQSQAMTGRSLAARGVNPASGAARGADRATSLQQAAMRTQAMTGSRQQAQQLGYARMLDAAGLGRGLAGASSAAYAGATGAGTAGMGTYMAPGNQYQAGLANAGQTFGNMANMQNQAFMQAQANEAGMWGSLVGAGATLGGAAITAGASDRRLKENILAVGEYEGLDLTKYQFNYTGDERVFIGVMADEVMELYPEAVFEMDNGYFAVDYESLGIEMEEIGFTEGGA